MTTTLRITEIFHSIQGESRPAGLPTAFVRLTGCPLRCAYCDTAYAFSGGTRMSIAEIVDQVSAYGAHNVCVTGGEPLAQPACLSLLAALCDARYAVSLETSGALDISAVDKRVHVVLDIKAPGSGEDGRNRWENLPLLASKDQVKIVICGRADYEWARGMLWDRNLAERCEVLMSPAWGQQSPRELAEWVLADRLPVRLQLQLHKYIWGDQPGR